MLRRARRGVLQVGEQRGRLLVPWEGHLTREALVQDTGERVLVGPAVHALARDLLGRHVVDRPHEVARLRQAALRLSVLGKPEVREVGVIGPLRARTDRHQDVRRLDVAVDQVLLVGRVECARGLRDDPDRSLGIQAPLLFDQPLEVGGPDVAHRDVQQAVRLARLEHRDDVRMVELGESLPLAHETRAERRILRELG